MMDKYKFGEFIYTHRKNLGMTQDELGRKLKVTNKAVSKWETGETLPDIQLLPELASVLNVTIDELLTQTKPEVEKVVIDSKKSLRNILWVISSVLLVLSIFFAFMFLREINHKEEILITVENANDYFEITPCQNIVNNGAGVIEVYGKIRAKDKEKLIDPVLVLNFTIQYYFINSEDKLSEILYTKIHVSYDVLTDEFSIMLEPESDINNFIEFYEVKISYEIVEASGRYVE